MCNSKHAWNYNPIKRNCLTCGKEFITIAAKVKAGKGKFCSKTCYLIDHGKNKWSTGVCKGCGKEFKYITYRHQVCCSLSCNMKWRIKLQNLEKKQKAHCLQCNKEFLVRQHKLKEGKGKFCSVKCYADWMSINKCGENSVAWKGGITHLYRGIRTLRKYYHWRQAILNRDGKQCTLCGSENTLEVDHIKDIMTIIKEYNIKTTLDANLCEELWDINNGRTLCKKCHVKTPTYGFKRSNNYIQ